VLFSFYFKAFIASLHFRRGTFPPKGFSAIPSLQPMVTWRRKGSFQRSIFFRDAVFLSDFPNHNSFFSPVFFS